MKFTRRTELASIQKSTNQKQERTVELSQVKSLRHQNRKKLLEQA